MEFFFLTLHRQKLMSFFCYIKSPNFDTTLPTNDKSKQKPPRKEKRIFSVQSKKKREN